MPEQDVRAGELQQAEKVPRMILPAGDQPPEVVEPGEKAFDFPVELDHELMAVRRRRPRGTLIHSSEPSTAVTPGGAPAARTGLSRVA